MQLIKLPLFGKATIEKNKRYSGTEISGLGIRHIGMGNTKTWHGSPDFRIRYVCVLSSDVEEDPYVLEPPTTSSSYVSHSSLSSPSVTNFEAKIQIQNVNRDQ